MNAQPKPEELRALELVRRMRDAGLDPRQIMRLRGRVWPKPEGEYREQPNRRLANDQ